MIDRLIDIVVSRSKLISFFLTGLGVVLAVFYWLQLTAATGRPVDVHAYWAADPNNLYPPAPSALHQDAYLYAPPFEMLIGWGRHLPFETFTAIWRAILLVALVWLAGPFTLFALLTVPVASEVNAGNIQLLLAVAIVLAFRPGRWWPSVWAFVLLTKITPGIGLLWFAARREWRALAVAIGATAVIAGVTFAIWPDRWLAWIALLTRGGSPEPLFPYYFEFWPRIALAVVVALAAAWRGWRWLVVVAATIALPAFYYVSPSLLVGVLPFARKALGRWAERRRATATVL